MSIQRFLVNICSDNLVASRDFYVNVLGLTVGFESDWFIQLSELQGVLELGIIDRQHEMVPETDQQLPQGTYLTFVVDDVEEAFQRAKDLSIEIVQSPQDTFYGQRRMLLRDPNGLLIDISALISKD